MLQSFKVRYVRIMIKKFAPLELELFAKPSNMDFLQIHQT